MSTEDIKLITLMIALFGLGFGVFQYYRSKPRYSFHLFPDQEVNSDGCGTYLCARVHISNSGGKTGVFGGFIAIDSNGSEFYPMCSLSSGTEIEPEKTISGVIPIGHLTKYPPKSLYMQDGLLKRKKVPTKLLKLALRGLSSEHEKYKKMVGQFTQPRVLKMHNKARNLTCSWSEI